MKVININETDGYKFDNLVKNKHNFVKFYHPQCHHCIAMRKTWNKLPNELNKKKYNNLNIVKIHANAISDINSNCSKNIMGFPTIMMVKPGGNEYEEFSGERDIISLKDFISKTYKDKKRDTKKINTKKGNTKKINTKKGNTKKINTKKGNTKKGNTKKGNTKKINTKKNKGKI